MNSARETFSKQERLCSIKEINSLFETGNVFHTSLFRVIWKTNNDRKADTVPVKVAFSVPRRGFPHAVTRNLIKRRMRETYRKNKSVLYEHLYSRDFTLSLFLILRTNSVPGYRAVEKSVIETINRIISLI